MAIESGHVAGQRHRHEVVQARKLHLTFHHALLVATRYPTEVMVKEVMAFELEKSLLKEKYTGNRSALFDFKKFLKKHGIPQKSDFWISFN